MSTALQDRLPYARAWYAVKNEKGEWVFGPSKFVGYWGLDAATDVATSKENNGRRTEIELKKWFDEVGVNSKLYDELGPKLSNFLARFEKAPSAKMRISVLKAELERDTATIPLDPNDKIVELLLAVARALPSSHLSKIRSALAKF